MEQQASGIPVAGEGGVQLGVLADLNNMDVDMSAALMPRKKPPQPEPSSSSSATSAGPRKVPGSAAGGTMPPRRPMRQVASQEPLSRLNAEKIKRQNRGASRAPTLTLASSRTEDEAEKERLVQLERERYDQMKNDFQVEIRAGWGSGPWGNGVEIRAGWVPVSGHWERVWGSGLGAYRYQGTGKEGGDQGLVGTRVSGHREMGAVAPLDVSIPTLLLSPADVDPGSHCDGGRGHLHLVQPRHSCQLHNRWALQHTMPEMGGREGVGLLTHRHHS